MCGVKLLIHSQTSTAEPLCATLSAGMAPVEPQCNCGSSGLPVFPFMHINTGLQLEDHWAISTASVVPVQSVQWYPSVLRASGLEVIRSGHFPAYSTLCIKLVRRELFWFHLYCNPKLPWCSYPRHAQNDVEVQTFEEQNWNAVESYKLQVNAEFRETCPIAACYPVIVSFQTGMDAKLYISVCVWAFIVPPVVFQCRLQ